MDKGIASAVVFASTTFLSWNAAAQTGNPTIFAVENAASYSPGPIAPGEMILITGTAMGPTGAVGMQFDDQGRVTTTLSDVQVLFDGNPAPLISVSDKQISAMVPYGLAGNATTQIQVVYQGATSDPFQQALAISAPGILTSDPSGKGQATVTNPDGSPNSPANPAAPGSSVTFFITGEGQTNPPGVDGDIVKAMANVVLPVSVRIAGRSAQFSYAGSAPGNVNGFAQITVVIPADLQYGGNIPLVIQIGDASSQTEVTVAVTGPPAPVPGTPQTISASPNSSGQIVLTWTPADGLATRFHLEQQTGADNFVEMANVPASVTTFTDQSVTAGVLYQYRVRAENDYGFSAYSTIANCTIPVASLVPPSSLQAVAVNQTQINLTWSAANSNASQFQIERKTGAAGVYSMIATPPNTATSYQDITVVPNSAYTYRMRSQGATGLSDYSNESSATTPPIPSPPAPVLQVTTISFSQIRLTWTTTAASILRFRVERRTTAGSYSEINQLSPTSTTFDDNGLSASTAYFYRLRVETDAGLSPYSNEATATTAPPLPSPPVLQAAPTSSSVIHLAWTTTEAGILRFHLV
jgi:uncharacterized protein (TIGR03437 family)